MLANYGFTKTLLREEELFSERDFYCFSRFNSAHQLLRDSSPLCSSLLFWWVIFLFGCQ
jgi:hypothetical protein